MSAVDSTHESGMKGKMRLQVLVPTEVLFDGSVTKAIAEADFGSFCLLPRHVDFVATLVPGLLSFVVDGVEMFMAVDDGLLVKCGSEVMVSTSRAIPGTDLVLLRDAVEREFRQQDERERQTRAALAHLETSVMRRFQEL